MRKPAFLTLTLVLTAVMFVTCGCTNQKMAEPSAPTVLPTNEEVWTTQATTMPTTMPTTKPTTTPTTTPADTRETENGGLMDGTTEPDTNQGIDSTEQTNVNGSAGNNSKSGVGGIGGVTGNGGVGSVAGNGGMVG